MNDDELATHDYIAAVLEQAADKLIDYYDVTRSLQGPLESFRPRCPRCGSVVSFTPWVDALRAARCGRCSHVWKEAV